MARLTDEQRSAIAADLKATWGTGEAAYRRVAERHGVSSSTVKVVADKLVEDGEVRRDEARAETKNATEALRADVAKRRADLSMLFLQRAREALDDMRLPAKIYNFGGKDNSYNERVVDQPPTGDQRNLMIIAATAVDKHKILDLYDSDIQAGAAVDAWLKAMTERPQS